MGIKKSLCSCTRETPVVYFLVTVVFLCEFCQNSDSPLPSLSLLNYTSLGTQILANYPFGAEHGTVFVSSGAAAWGDSALCSKNSLLTSFPFTKVCVIAPVSTADEE
jgi:hypothetical protein